jgi:hypothetical protein
MNGGWKVVVDGTSRDSNNYYFVHELSRGWMLHSVP